MDELLFRIFFWGVFVFGGTVFVIFCLIMAVRQYKRDLKKGKSAHTEADDTPLEINATVIDQSCCVKTVGSKTPKTTTEFLVVFQTESGETLKLNVPEAMYDGFALGQTGVLTLVDGELYSFALQEGQ